ncbi:hypothetical protein ABI_12900 [Asticcacaulis biprosthecium C19]|uniref:Uncharacterized protein n=1 Tax=Asticcacaulis biprosthecium C19 TaxID=715226 RepID=F4QHW5_9CAUL|nr:hypothetical protein ABI_12900 [Asticcacaulis biprosthecium C19]
MIVRTSSAVPTHVGAVPVIQVETSANRQTGVSAVKVPRLPGFS